MKKAFSLFIVSLTFATLVVANAAPVVSTRGAVATISGSVNDAHGNPVAGAIVSLLREGANEVAKQVKTDPAGHFSAKVVPGLYGIRAIANGFNEVVFNRVQVRASQELIYRFNLEPVGSGKTLPEQRKDREDVKWTLRSAQTRRSIFQAQEGDSEDIKAVLNSDDSVDATDETADVQPDLTIPSFDRRPQGVVETYYASNPYGLSYTGLNFAVAVPATGQIDLVVAGQTGSGPGAPERFEALTRLRAGNRHRIAASVEGMRFASPVLNNTNSDLKTLGQFSVRAIDEWIVRDGVVVVFGLDYSRFIRNGAHSLTPRFGIQFDANAKTRVTAAYAPGGNENNVQSVASFEDTQVAFTDAGNRPVAYVDGRAVMERSHRLEFGVERVLDNNSNVEASAFFDTTTGHGVGLLSIPMSALADTTGESLITVANQQGAARGLRIVYNRRLSHVWTASAGYSFGRGQRLSPDGFTNPSEVFSDGFFQTAAVQVGAGFSTGTHVRTVLRFSPEATVFAIDPFAGRLGVYDPSLSILVTQDLPSFGLPLRAEAIIDARNLMDVQTSSDGSEVLTLLSTGRRSVRGGISVRF